MIFKGALFVTVNFSMMLIATVAQAQTPNLTDHAPAVEVSGPSIQMGAKYTDIASEVDKRFRDTTAASPSSLMLEGQRIMRKTDPDYVLGVTGPAYVASNLADLEKMETLIQGLGPSESVAEHYAPKLLKFVKSGPWRGLLGVVSVGALGYQIYQFAFLDDFPKTVAPLGVIPDRNVLKLNALGVGVYPVDSPLKTQLLKDISKTDSPFNAHAP